MAIWLDSTFYNFDKAVFNAFHNLAVSAGGFFTPFFKVVSFFGEGGVFFIILSLVLMLFKNTRRTGFAMLLALGIGALFTNVIIKNAVARTRPFNAREEYKEFWKFVSAKEQSEYSFPSGHVTATTSAMTALFLTRNKKWSWVGYLLVVAMCASRVYLFVHYTSDVLAGVIVGIIAGTLSYLITKYVYKKFIRFSHKKFCLFLLNADIVDCFKKTK